jgi:hypothetical protein
MDWNKPNEKKIRALELDVGKQDRIVEALKP